MKFKIWTPKNGLSLRIYGRIRVPSPIHRAYALFPCPLGRFCWLFFGWHHEVINQIFGSIDERYSICHLTGQVRSVIVQRTFYPLHIRYIFLLSVIHPLLIRQSTLVDRSLSVTCPLNMRYSCVLCAPYMFSEDPHRHRDNFLSPDDHWINIFCIFSVRSASLNLIR